MVNTIYAWFFRYYLHYFVQADRKEKCPSCGIRQYHPMKYDLGSKKVLHYCKTLHAEDKTAIGCGAIWGIDCLVNPTKWEIVETSVDEQGRATVEQPEKKFVHVSREPIIVKKEGQK